MKRTGGCLCGNIRYEADSEPVMSGVCHCKNCQKQAGSAFSTLSAFLKADFDVTGDLSLYEDSDTETKGTVKRYFCGKCGSPIHSEVPGQPDLAFVKTGTLDNTDDFVAMFHCWSSTKQVWVELNPEVPAFEQNPAS